MVCVVAGSADRQLRATGGAGAEEFDQRLVRNRRACHVRLYQLVRNGKEGWGVPGRMFRRFRPDWKRFAAAVRRWEDDLRPLADGRTVQAVRNTDDQIREAFEQAVIPPGG